MPEKGIKILRAIYFNCVLFVWSFQEDFIFPGVLSGWSSSSPLPISSRTNMTMVWLLRFCLYALVVVFEGQPATATVYLQTNEISNKLDESVSNICLVLFLLLVRICMNPVDCWSFPSFFSKVRTTNALSRITPRSKLTRDKVTCCNSLRLQNLIIHLQLIIFTCGCPSRDRYPCNKYCYSNLFGLIRNSLAQFCNPMH